MPHRAPGAGKLTISFPRSQGRVPARGPRVTCQCAADRGVGVGERDDPAVAARRRPADRASSSSTGRATRSSAPSDAGDPGRARRADDFGPDFDRLAYTERVVDALKRHEIDLVAMAGFMTILEQPDPRRVRRPDHEHAPVAAARVQGRARGRGCARRRGQGDRLHRPPRDARGGPRADPRPGSGAGARPATPSRRSTSASRRSSDAVPAGAPRRCSRRRREPRALLSVYDKTGLVELARGLRELGFELVSSGKTAAALRGARRPGHDRSRTSPARPRCSTGASKTLHPRIHGGILADLGKDRHRADLEAQGIAPFDLVVSNLYPFLEQPDIETIDIGGPAMVRAAAKNHAWVGVVTSPAQYEDVLDELREQRRQALRRDPPAPRARGVRAHRRVRRRHRALAASATSCLPRHLVLALERTDDELRYGENPHQQAARYRTRRHAPAGGTTSPSTAASRSRTSTSTTPRRRGSSRTISATARRAPSSSTPTRAASPSPTTSPTAYRRALECDELSAFGGIVALNRPVDGATAERMVAGPQADVDHRPRLRAGHARRAGRRSARTRACSRRPRRDTRPARLPPAHRRLPRAGGAALRRRPRRRGGSSPKLAPTDGAVARRRARLAACAGT